MVHSNHYGHGKSEYADTLISMEVKETKFGNFHLPGLILLV